MPRVDADFTGISSSFEPLADQTMFNFQLNEVVDQANDDEWKAKNALTGKTPALVFISEVVDGDRVGAQFFDHIYTKQKDGKVNKIGLGRIKAYAEAILGKEEANTPDGMDTDRLLKGRFGGFIKHRQYVDQTTKEQKTSVDLAKILPAG